MFSTHITTKNVQKNSLFDKKKKYINLKNIASRTTMASFINTFLFILKIIIYF